MGENALPIPRSHQPPLSPPLHQGGEKVHDDHLVIEKMEFSRDIEYWALHLRMKRSPILRLSSTVFTRSLTLIQDMYRR